MASQKRNNTAPSPSPWNCPRCDFLFAPAFSRRSIPHNLPGTSPISGCFRIPREVLLALYLLWLEIFCGTALEVFQKSSQGALFILTALSLIFLAALISAKLRGLDISTCGCFGHSSMPSPLRITPARCHDPRIHDPSPHLGTQSGRAVPLSPDFLSDFGSGSV